MAHSGPGKRITFPALAQIVFECGMSVSQVSQKTGVARNTIAAIMSGKEVKPLTVKKILDGLSKEHDVSRHLRALNDRTLAAATATGGGGAKLHLAAVGGTITDAQLVNDAKEMADRLADILRQIADRKPWQTSTVGLGDLEFLWANIKKLTVEVELVQKLRTFHVAPS